MSFLFLVLTIFTYRTYLSPLADNRLLSLSLLFKRLLPICGKELVPQSRMGVLR